MTTAKDVVENVLSIPTTKKLWTANYFPALPFTPQDFSLGAVLPAVLYMFRWGHRRGQGTFAKTFGKQFGLKITPPIIEDVVNKLIKNPDWFEGLDNPTGKAILGDMLMTFCLENKGHQMGRTEQVQRTFPTHYLASWIDLPERVVNLRYIPEMLLSILASQEKGEFIGRSAKQAHFSVGTGFDDNILLRLFGTGMQTKGTHIGDLTADQFIETESESFSVGLDQLLTIRIAQACGEAPTRARGGGEIDKIPNQRPLAKKATKELREDFSVFMQAYGETIPRQAFLQMLESCMALGLTNIYVSTADMLLRWEQSGVLPDFLDQNPWPLFVDCSSGNDIKLRRLAEQSMFDLLRRFERLSVIMMCLRILDDKVRFDRILREQLPATQPDATEFINLFGKILKGADPRAEKVLDGLDETCLKLAEALKEAEEEQAIQELLKGSSNPATRLAEAICLLMGNNLQGAQYLKALNSCLMIDQPNGLAKKRKIQIKDASGKKIFSDSRSIVLTNTMLDFLVHRHLRKAAKGKIATTLTFIDFIKLLRLRYGLYVDESPLGMHIPSEFLQKNRTILERRLRDLGVLIGVNDAESMKRLHQRFKAKGDDND